MIWEQVLNSHSALQSFSLFFFCQRIYVLKCTQRFLWKKISWTCMLHFQVKQKGSKIQNCQLPKLCLNSHCDVLPWESLPGCLTPLLLDPGSSIYYLLILLLSLVMTTYLLILFLAGFPAHIGSKINHLLDPSFLSSCWATCLKC